MVNEAIDIAVRVGELTDSRLVARRLWNPDVVAIASPTTWRAGERHRIRMDLAITTASRFFNPNTGRVLECGHDPRRSPQAGIRERTCAGRQP